MGSDAHDLSKEVLLAIFACHLLSKHVHVQKDVLFSLKYSKHVCLGRLFFLGGRGGALWVVKPEKFVGCCRASEQLCSCLL